MERKPNRKVVDSLLAIPRDEIYLTCIVLGELRYGIDRLPESSRKSQLSRYYQASVLDVFADRILAVDIDVAHRWGRLAADMEAAGATMQANDSWIAAVALTHGLTVVTRNVDDFVNSGVVLLNPWEAA